MLKALILTQFINNFLPRLSESEICKIITYGIYACLCSTDPNKKACIPLHTCQNYNQNYNICQNYNPPGALLDRSGVYAFVKKVPGCSKFI